MSFGADADVAKLRCKSTPRCYAIRDRGAARYSTSKEDVICDEEPTWSNLISKSNLGVTERIYFFISKKKKETKG